MFEITAIVHDGKPIEPIWTKDAFRAQCGVLVRDKISISIHQWLKPKKDDLHVSFVEDRQKEDLWKALKVNFTLPEEDGPENPVIDPLIKSCALKKMEDLFRRWKNELKTMLSTKKRLHNSPAGLRRSEITGTHLWPTRHRTRVRRCQQQTR